MNIKDISIKDFDYVLPPERIAKYPLPQRDQSKLLLYRHGEVSEDVFSNLPLHLPEGALMVFNNTRVIHARLRFQKETGASVEVFLLEPASPAEYAENFATRGECTWSCLVGNLKRWREGDLKRTLTIGDVECELIASRTTDLSKRRTAAESASPEHLITFHWTSPHSWAEVLEAAGEMPIPPYLNRRSEASDNVTYQTVYGKVDGSVAAPTAGLHFTPEVLTALKERDIEREEVTLHVGAGTFRPVKSDTIGGHDMHTEHIAVPRQTIEALLRHNARAIAVGTTSVRTLESLYYMGIRAYHLMQEGCDTDDAYTLSVRQWEPYEMERDPSPLPTAEEALTHLLAYMDKHALDVLHTSTQIIIVPGYQYRIVSAMVTNFHQPQSTLLLLVSAFIGNRWRRVYDYALYHQFRFLSYGDSSLLIP